MKKRTKVESRQRRNVSTLNREYHLDAYFATLTRHVVFSFCLSWVITAPTVNDGADSDEDDIDLAARRSIGQQARAPRRVDDPEELTEQEKHELKLAARRKREKEYRDAVRKATQDLESEDPTVAATARAFLATPRKRGRPGAKAEDHASPSSDGDENGPSTTTTTTTITTTTDRVTKKPRVKAKAKTNDESTTLPKKVVVQEIPTVTVSSSSSDASSESESD